jgi:hypothetical protein
VKSINESHYFSSSGESDELQEVAGRSPRAAGDLALELGKRQFPSLPWPSLGVLRRSSTIQVAFS